MKATRCLRILIWCLCLSLSAILCAEDTVLKQFQTFRWKPVARAKKYEVLVQQKNADGTWVKAESQETKDIRVEMLLYPGDYRVSISAFNVLGKKASSSPWIDFVILNETEPYLSPDIFTKDGTYNDFVLRRTQTLASADETVQEEDAPAKDPSFGYLTVSGRNIFFPETTFTLIPIDNEQFPSYMDKRPEVSLPVIVRDREQNKLEVSLDWSKLYAGYYRFEVKNPGGENDSATVLVQPERNVALNEKAFDYYRRYKVRRLSVMRQSQPTTLTIKGTDFQADSVIQLVPSTGIPYPFASEKERNPLTLKVLSCANAGSDSLEMKLELDTLLVETGYYALTIKTPGLTDTSLNLLVDVKLPPEQLPEIKKVKTKLDKSDKSVQFAVEGARLSFSLSGESLVDGSSAVLIAPCDEHGVNKRIPLMLDEAKKNGKKITFDADSDMLTGGTYALMIETPSGTQITYIELSGGSFAAKMVTMTEEQAEEKFLRSETLDEPVVVKKVAPAPVASSVEFTAAANAAAFLDASKWKRVSNTRIYCYDKEVDGQKRLAMRFPAIREDWSRFENKSEDALALLRSGTGVRITILNDSENARGIEIYLPITKKRRNSSGESVLSYGLTIPPLTTQTYSIPYRDFKNSEGKSSGQTFDHDFVFKPENILPVVSCDFDATRIQGIEIHPSGGQQRVEITELFVFDDTLPDGSQPFYNDHWVRFYDDENITLENLKGKFSLRMTANGTMLSPGNHYLTLFSNYSRVLAQELCGAQGVRFTVSGDRKAEWNAVLVQKDEDGSNRLFYKYFTVLPDVTQTITVPYEEFGAEFDASRIIGFQFSRKVYSGDNPVTLFTSTIHITEMTAYGNGKTMHDDTYVVPAGRPGFATAGISDAPLRAIPGFDSTYGWRAFFWDNAEKTSTSVPVPAEMQNGKIIFTADSVSYDWNSLCFSMQNNAEANAVLATADGIQFDALYTGKNLEAAHWRCRIIQKAEDGTDVFFVKRLSLKRGKTVHVVLPYEDFKDSYIVGISGTWTKTNAYPFDRSKICTIEFEPQRRDGTQTPIAKTFSTQLALSDVCEYKDSGEVGTSR